MNENKAVLNPKKEETECDAEQDSSLEFSMLPAYSKKAATRNMKALESYSSQLLHILSDLFISSPPQTRISLKVSHFSIILQIIPCILIFDIILLCSCPENYFFLLLMYLKCTLLCHLIQFWRIPRPNIALLL